MTYASGHSILEILDILEINLNTYSYLRKYLNSNISLILENDHTFSSVSKKLSPKCSLLFPSILHFRLLFWCIFKDFYFAILDKYLFSKNILVHFFIKFIFSSVSYWIIFNSNILFECILITSWSAQQGYFGGWFKIEVLWCRSDFLFLILLFWFFQIDSSLSTGFQLYLSKCWDPCVSPGCTIATCLFAIFLPYFSMLILSLPLLGLGAKSTSLSPGFSVHRPR